MNHSFLHKTKLASAIALASASFNAKADFVISITAMNFSGIYAASGSILEVGGGSFTGSFFGHTWVADQVTLPMDNTGTWTGSNALGPWDYNAAIATVPGDKFAVGVLFDWSTSVDIPVLEVFTCANSTDGVAPSVCTGVGEPMQTGPFAGSSPGFNGTGAGFNPVAVDDTIVTDANTLIDKDVLANDSDKDYMGGVIGSTPAGFTINIVTGPFGTGTAVHQGGGVIRYTPDSTLITGNTDSFTYTVTDHTGNVSNTATASINIGTNSLPVATGYTLLTDEDVDKNLLAIDVATDTDIVDGQILTFINVGGTSANGGSIIVDGSGEFLTYSPAADYYGIDTFDLDVFDGFESITVTQSVTVGSVNDAPICPAVNLATDVDVPLVVTEVDLLPDCTDVENDPVTYVSLSATQPTNAMLADDGAGNLTITPNAGFAGDAVFQIEATDGNTGGQIAIPVTVKVGTIFSNFTMINEAGDTIGGTNDIIFTWDGTSYNTNEADTNFGKMTIVSAGPQPFNSYLWEAHHVRVYPEGTYSFDTSCSTAQYDAGTTSCGGSDFITMTVGPGQVGGHILFNWGKPNTGTTPCGVANCDIDVVNVWDVDGVWDRHGGIDNQNKLYDGQAGAAPDPETTWELVSTDVKGFTDVSGVLQAEGNNINGAPMIDGPFIGFYANFSSTPGATTTGAGDPVPHEQGDTDLGGSFLASMDIVGLFGSLMSLFGLRHIRRKR